MDESFDIIPKQIIKEIQKEMLNRLLVEQNRNVLLQVSEALGALTCRLMRDTEWNEIMSTLIKLSQSSNAFHREAFLVVLDKFGFGFYIWIFGFLDFFCIFASKKKTKKKKNQTHKQKIGRICKRCVKRKYV